MHIISLQSIWNNENVKMRVQTSVQCYKCLTLRSKFLIVADHLYVLPLAYRLQVTLEESNYFQNCYLP